MNFPIELMQMMNSGNPQQVMMNFLKQNVGNNPILSNAFQLVQNGRYDEIENLARNLCKEKGIDADVMMNQLKSQLK